MTKAELKYIVNKSTAIQINIGINIHNFVLLSNFFIFTTAFALYYHIIGKGVKQKLFHFIVSIKIPNTVLSLLGDLGQNSELADCTFVPFGRFGTKLRNR
jgi:hypothetical protein